MQSGSIPLWRISSRPCRLKFWMGRKKIFGEWNVLTQKCSVFWPPSILTRRRHRNTERPVVQENLSDPPEAQLLRERNNLTQAQRTMIQRMEDSQRILKELQDRKDWLHKELRIKTTSLEIDQNEVLPRRATFPSESTLMGYWRCSTIISKKFKLCEL